MVKKVIWSRRAVEERAEILEYWKNRNKSAVYSQKLNLLIRKTVRSIAKFPNIGIKTDLTDVRFRTVRDYLIFYEMKEDTIQILTIWDGRRNPDTFKIK